MNHTETEKTTHKANYEVFREYISVAVVERSEEKGSQKDPKSARPARRRARKNVKKDTTTTTGADVPERVDPEELAEFVDFIATELFHCFPPNLQNLTYSALHHNPHLQKIYSTTPLPNSTLEELTHPLLPIITDSLTVYGLIPSPSDLPDFLSGPLSEYIDTVASPPPAIWSQTRTDACEICERDWIPLSYHHLIPKDVHEKVRKKGWHEEWMLNSVAWLCRACHSFVHRMASNEELAREWFTVERILSREDVRVWKGWVGRVRWKAT